MNTLENFEELIQEAIECFWDTRKRQGEKQETSGKKDMGNRGNVTGGKHMEGFEHLVVRIARECGISENSIFYSQNVELPGYFRPTKKWDLLIVDDGFLVAAIEFKSHTGPSFGNNFNNRTEEAIGTAQDLWVAYRERAIRSILRPWLGYLLLLEDHPDSTKPRKPKEPHFAVFPEFKGPSPEYPGSSYAKRYEELLLRLIYERLYDSCCLLLSSATSPYTTIEPNETLMAKHFFSMLTGHLATYVKMKNE
ncbi:PaeR7I family type II restriction endonuclease [Pannus brasiliensis CCIBt3594]|uniref:PaeR7I family type II restriction endonuclease n=1 Tax=Pannus brasiliensis CCIBt3594 TaxID=1427578 RepID=A0AAW9QUU3_9CHRO